MSELLDFLTPLLHSAEISLSPAQLAQLDGHFRLLVEWNELTNLTGITDPADAANLHYLDSLAAVPDLVSRSTNVKTWLDIGSGAGFPGIPLAIALPELKFILFERRERKAGFLIEAVNQLNLGDQVTVVCETLDPHTAPRLLGHVSRETFGMCARALEKMPDQLPKLLKIPGLATALFWLGSKAADEATAKYGATWNMSRRTLPSGPNRDLVILER